MATCTSGCGRGDGVGGDGGAAATIAVEILATGDFGAADAAALPDVESICSELCIDDDANVGDGDSEVSAFCRCWCCIALRKARLFAWAAAVAASLWSRCSNGDTGEATDCRD